MPVAERSIACGGWRRLRWTVLSLSVLFGCQFCPTSTSTPDAGVAVDAGFDAGSKPSLPDHPMPPPFTPENFSASLSAAETVPLLPSSSAPSGTVGQVDFTLTRDTSTFEYHLHYHLTHSLEDATFAFIYFGLPGVSGTPLVDLGPPLADVQGDLSLDQDLVDELQTAQWYVLLMSRSFPQGAVRGQILTQGAAPPELYVAQLSGALAQPPSSSSQNAVVAVILDPASATIEVTASSSATLGSLTLVSQTGGALLSMTPADTTFTQKVATPITDQVTALRNGQLSVNGTISGTTPVTISAPLLPPGWHVYTATMNGAQVVPPVSSSNTGWAWVMVDYSGTNVEVVGSTTELNPTAISLVSVTPSGVTTIASEAFTTGGGADGGTVADGGAGSEGTAFYLTATQIPVAENRAIALGLASVVIATSADQAGEISGPVTLPGEQVFQAALQPGFASPPNASNRTGTAWAYLSADGSTVRIAFQIAFPILSATWDTGLPGAPQVTEHALALGVGTTPGTNSAASTVTGLSPDNLAALLSDRWRIFVSTQRYQAPASEFGGQFVAAGSSLFVAHMNAQQVVPPPSASPAQLEALVVVNQTGSQAEILSDASAAASAVTVGDAIAGLAASMPLLSLSQQATIWQGTLPFPAGDAGQRAALARGLWYIQADHQQGGIIRGQLLAPGEILYVAAPVGTGMVPPLSPPTNDSATLQFVLDPVQSQLRFDGVVDATSPLFVEILLCSPGAALDFSQMVGSPVQVCPGVPGSCSGSTTVSSPLISLSNETALQMSELCAVVTSVQDPAGELRATINVP